MRVCLYLRVKSQAMSSTIKAIFHRKPQSAPQPLSIEEDTVRLTPRPDEAELAATALLEMLTGESDPTARHDKESKHGKDTPEYYHDLAHRIQANQEHKLWAAQRIVAYCEEQLGELRPQDGKVHELEDELYTVQSIVEREGAELFARWQHCLAEVAIRQMQQARREKTDDEEPTIILRPMPQT